MENSNYKNKTIETKYLNSWDDLLISYIPDSIRKIVGGFKDKVVSLFNTSKPKQTEYGAGKKLSQSETKKQSEENTIKAIRNLFILKKENKKI